MCVELVAQSRKAHARQQLFPLSLNEAAAEQRRKQTVGQQRSAERAAPTESVTEAAAMGPIPLHRPGIDAAVRYGRNGNEAVALLSQVPTEP